MKLFIFAASLRKGSLNKLLIKQVFEILKNHPEVTIDMADFKEFSMPVYDGDIEIESGIPAGALALTERIRAADAIIISTPEYNGGMPGALKNALDWVSRSTPIAFTDKPLLFIGASPGALGAVRSLWHSRVPFEAIGAMVYPEMFGLPLASKAFAEDGKLIDPKNAERLSKLVGKYLIYANNFQRK